MKLETLQDMYLTQLKDLYSAEEQLIEALPEMADTASNSELADAFKQHLEQTKEHRQRLEQVFQNLAQQPGGMKSQGIAGLISDGEQIAKADAEPDVRDAGLIAAAQRVEHCEIAAYGTVCTYAEMLNRRDDFDLLSKTLSEEKETDAKLNTLAKQLVNPQAAEA